LLEELVVEEVGVGVELLDELLVAVEAELSVEDDVVAVDPAGASFFWPSADTLFSPSDGGFSLLE
jgi:hypothetical protein